MKQLKYTSIDRIFSKINRDLTSDFSERDIIEWAGEALEAIGTRNAYSETIAFLEVKNHQCEIPSGTHALVQIARYNAWGGPKTTNLCVAEVATECAPADFDFAVFHYGTDSTSFVPTFNFDLSYHAWRNSSCYKNKFSPVRLKTHNFFNSIVCKEVNDYDAIYSSSTDEYTIIAGKTLRFSFQDGLVAILLLKQQVDKETGYPLIPDTFSHTTAIVRYVTWMMLEKQCTAGREAACGKADRAEIKWHWYCKQASNLEMMPYGEDENQNLLDQRSYLLPRQHRYYGFFGNLNKPEDRSGFNDPNNRNGLHLTLG